MSKMIRKWPDFCICTICQVLQRMGLYCQRVERLLGQVGMTTNDLHQRLELSLSFQRTLIAAVEFPYLIKREIAKRNFDPNIKR